MASESHSDPSMGHGSGHVEIYVAIVHDIERKDIQAVEICVYVIEISRFRMVVDAIVCVNAEDVEKDKGDGESHTPHLLGRCPNPQLQKAVRIQVLHIGYVEQVFQDEEVKSKNARIDIHPVPSESGE